MDKIFKAELAGLTGLQLLAANKLPKDFEKQGKTMTQRYAYLVKVHNNLRSWL